MSTSPKRRSADGPIPRRVRRISRGVAAVIAPFNFPLHLGHGAAVAHLLAGNPVIFKPSPLAANVAARYAEIMRRAFPPGVFGLVQGGAEEAQALALDPRVQGRFVSPAPLPRGKRSRAHWRRIFRRNSRWSSAGETQRSFAAMPIWQKPPMPWRTASASRAASAAMRPVGFLVEESVSADFEAALLESVKRYQPGDPLDAKTKLGPLISEAAVDRYSRLGRRISRVAAAR